MISRGSDLGSPDSVTRLEGEGCFIVVSSASHVPRGDRGRGRTLMQVPGVFFQ